MLSRSFKLCLGSSIWSSLSVNRLRRRTSIIQPSVRKASWTQMRAFRALSQDSDDLVRQDLRLCYNLWSVEKSSSPEWSIRQTAVYHSFDIDNGRSVWINIKGNKLMQERITQSVKSFSPLQASASKTNSGAFSATLHTHILIMEWSAENWRSLISSLKKDIGSVLDKAQSIPFRAVERALTVDLSVLLEHAHLKVSETTHGGSQTRTNSGLTNTQFSRAPTSDSNWSKFSTRRIRSGLSKISTGTQPTGLPSPSMSPTILESLPPILNPLTTIPDPWDIWKRQSVRGLQAVHFRRTTEADQYRSEAARSKLGHELECEHTWRNDGILRDHGKF